VLGVLIALSCITVLAAGCTPGHDNGVTAEPPGATEAVSALPKILVRLPASPRSSSVSGVQSMLGHRLPLPDYMPPSLSVMEVYYARSPGSNPAVVTVYLLVSDRPTVRTGSEFQCTLLLEIGWNEAGLGLKMPEAEYVPEIRGRLVKTPGEHVLWLESYGDAGALGSTLRLHVSPQFPPDELLKVAVSIPSTEAPR